MKYNTPEEALKDVFGYDNFRASQKEIIQASLDGRDGLCIMATGGGKSICFQIPGLMKEGTTIVVSPLIALMKDQVDSLRKNGVKAACFYHQQDDEEKSKFEAEVLSGKSDFIYVSPERLANEDFYQILLQLEIAGIVLDEAHCVSTWGHDFRPDYRKVGGIIQRLEKDIGKRIQVSCFTATATPETIEDIKTTLDLDENLYQYVGPFDRPNIDMEVRKANNKFEEVRDILSQSNGETTIVYSPTIKGVLQLQSYLKRNGIEASIYHGKLSPEQKKKAQEDFINGKSPLMIATTAFGAGIDVPDIRNVILMGMPGNLEDYAQLIGRAGRDGKPSRSVTVYNPNDSNIHHFFINGSYPDKKIIESVFSALMTFDQSAPINVPKEEIANRAPSNLTEYEVDSSLRIMQENQMISTMSEFQSKDVGIEFLDMTREIDYDHLDIRKSHSYDKLGAMQRFCETTTCRRTFLLDYLGENHRAGMNCGSCDNCTRSMNAQKEFKEEYPGEAVLSALTLIREGEGKISSVNAGRLLRGVESRMFSRKGWTNLDGFGALESWMTPKLDGMIRQLQRSNLISEIGETGKLKITGEGIKWIQEAMGNHKPALGNEARKDSVYVDLKTKKFLEEWNEYKAKDLGCHPSAVLTPESIDNLAAEKREITLGVISEAGIPKGKLALFGMDLIKDLKLHQKRQYEQAESMGLG